MFLKCCFPFCFKDHKGGSRKTYMELDSLIPMTESYEQALKHATAVFLVSHKCTQMPTLLFRNKYINANLFDSAPDVQDAIATFSYISTADDMESVLKILKDIFCDRVVPGDSLKMYASLTKLYTKYKQKPLSVKLSSVELEEFKLRKRIESLSPNSMYSGSLPLWLRFDFTEAFTDIRPALPTNQKHIVFFICDRIINALHYFHKIHIVSIFDRTSKDWTKIKIYQLTHGRFIVLTDNFIRIERKDFSIINVNVRGTDKEMMGTLLITADQYVALVSSLLREIIELAYVDKVIDVYYHISTHDFEVGTINKQCTGIVPNLQIRTAQVINAPVFKEIVTNLHKIDLSPIYS